MSKWLDKEMDKFQTMKKNLRVFSFAKLIPALFFALVLWNVLYTGNIFADILIFAAGAFAFYFLAGNAGEHQHLDSSSSSDSGYTRSTDYVTDTSYSSFPQNINHPF